MGLGPVGRAQAPDCSVTLTPDQSIQAAIEHAHRGDAVGHDSHLRLVDSVVENNGSPDAGPVIANAGVVAGVANIPTKAHRADEPVRATLELVDSRIVGNHLGVLVGSQTELTMTGSAIQGSASWGLAASAPACIDGDWPGFADFQTVKRNLHFGRGSRIAGNNASGDLDGQGNPGTHPFHDLPDGQVCLP